jgi:hypothetical protein
MRHKQAIRCATNGYQLLKRVGERIPKQCPTLTRLTHKLDVLAAAVWSVGLLAILSTIYAFSPVAASGDSRWSLHTAMSLIRGHAGDLTEYMPALERNDFYAIEYVDGRPHTSFPIGVSILAIPAVAIGSLVRPAFFQELQNSVPDRFEEIVASITGATASVVFFWVLYSQFGSLWTALAGTGILALGTSMWSTATRALVQHGPLVLMFAIVMLLMVQAFRRPSLVQYAGLVLAMGYIVRPTAAVAIVVISIYVLVFYRAWFLRYLGWAMVAAIPWMIFNYFDLRRHSTTLLRSLPDGLTFIPRSAGHFVQPLARASSVHPRNGFCSQRICTFAARTAATASPYRLCGHSGRHHVYHRGVARMVGRPLFWTPSYDGRSAVSGVLCRVQFSHAGRDEPMGKDVPFGKHRYFRHRRCADSSPGRVAYGPWEWNYIPHNIDNRYRVWDWKDPQFLRTRAQP